MPDRIVPVSDPDVSRPRLIRDASFLEVDRREIARWRGRHNTSGSCSTACGPRRPTGCARWPRRVAASRWCPSCTKRGATRSTRPSTCTASSSTALVEDRLDDMLKAQRHAVNRIVHRYGRLGAVLLDPDVGDAELRTRLLFSRTGDAVARGPVRPGELDAGRPQGPLRADRRAARRAEPVRRAVFWPG